MEEPTMEEGAEGDLTQGYTIEVSCLPDGTYKVSGPEPLAVEAAEETGAPGSETGQDFDSIGAALKGIMDLIKQNPMGSDGQKAFEAGFGG